MIYAYAQTNYRDVYIKLSWGLWVWRPKNRVLFSCKGQEIVLFSNGSRPAWGSNQTSQYKGTGALSTGVNLRACGGNHSPPFIPKLRMWVAESRLVPMPSWLSQGKLHLCVFVSSLCTILVLARMWWNTNQTATCCWHRHLRCVCVSYNCHQIFILTRKLSSIHAETELTPWLPGTYLIVILSCRVRYLNVYLVWRACILKVNINMSEIW